MAEYVTPRALPILVPSGHIVMSSLKMGGGGDGDEGVCSNMLNEKQRRCMEASWRYILPNPPKSQHELQRDWGLRPAMQVKFSRPTLCVRAEILPRQAKKEWIDQKGRKGETKMREGNLLKSPFKKEEELYANYWKCAYQICKYLYVGSGRWEIYASFVKYANHFCNNARNNERRLVFSMQLTSFLMIKLFDKKSCCFLIWLISINICCLKG